MRAISCFNACQKTFGDTHPSMFREHGCNVYLAAEMKKHVSVPVATIGGLNLPEQMEQILAEGIHLTIL